MLIAPCSSAVNTTCDGSSKLDMTRNTKNKDPNAVIEYLAGHVSIFLFFLLQAFLIDLF